MDERVPGGYRDSCAKKEAAFFRNSISILASRSSARSLLFSADCSEDASASTASGWSFLHFWLFVFEGVVGGTYRFG